MPSMKEQVDDIHVAIFGKDGYPGMKIEVDRNTQHRKSNRWWMRLLIAAVVGSVITSTFALIQ